MAGTRLAPFASRSRAVAGGHTLAEMVALLAILGAGSWSVAVGARRVAERAAVEAAREEVVALIARARREAILYGAAEVVLIPEPPGAALVAEGEKIARTPDLARAYGVRMDAGGGGRPVRIRWDAMGLGRTASRTVAFDRGRARAELVISAYGRVRRR